jgi:hypothetical protein
MKLDPDPPKNQNTPSHHQRMTTQHTHSHPRTHRLVPFDFRSSSAYPVWASTPHLLSHNAQRCHQNTNSIQRTILHEQCQSRYARYSPFNHQQSNTCLRFVFLDYASSSKTTYRTSPCLNLSTSVVSDPHSRQTCDYKRFRMLYYFNASTTALNLKKATTTHTHSAMEGVTIIGKVVTVGSFISSGISSRSD